MKKAVYVILATVSVLAIIVAAIALNQQGSQTSEPSNEGVEAYTTYDVFKLAIRLEKGEFGIGEIIKMNIRLINTGEEDATIRFTTRPNPDPYWFWRVYDENDQLVFYHKYVAMSPAEEEITLEPGEVMQRNYTWNQRATNNGQQVPPGTYYLTAAVGFFYNREEVTLETQVEIVIKPI